MENLPALQDNQVDLLISQAIDKNVSVETLERLLIMRKELKQEYAKEEFDRAMAEFQAKCPIIKKTKEIRTNDGRLAYRYAPIESIVSQVKNLLYKLGFSYTILTKTAVDEVTATCIVKHILGHTESSSFTVPLGNKTSVM